MTAWLNGFFAALVLVSSLCLSAPSTRAADAAPPAPPSTAQLEISASTAFNRGAYMTALPMLKKLADAFKDDPAKLGPIQEKIRVCEKALTAIKAIPTPPPAAAPSSGQKRKPHPTPKPGEVLEMTIPELGNFDYDQQSGGNIPADVLALNGAKIRLTGFMLPLDQAENITQFGLVSSLFACACNLGGPPQIQHTIVANCPKGKAVSYCPDPIIVEGKLTVEEKKDDGYIISVFSLEVTSVKPAPK
ncbi:MAG TPA: DUF3299 domain-containing protein [Tepidisphaeraceae bacterium]|jgi:hypothetical protein|nr:DUF3299 domain-containing protein [Tepidisphaeraceae bacterium]